MTKDSFSSYAKIPQSHSVSVYFCGREQCEKCHAWGPAIRTQYLFHYVLSGKGIFRTEKATYTLTAGQGFLIFPDQITYYEADANDPWEYVWIGFDGTEAAQILAEAGMSVKNPIYQEDPHGPMEKTMVKLAETFRDQNGKCEILALFYKVMSIMGKEAIPLRRGEKGYVEQALDYIHHNYAYRIRIDDIARCVGLDRTYLFKLFTKNTGVAPQEYLIRYRLEHAANLLSETKLSTEQIACSCGFRDAPSFCKHFRARYNSSPLAYRKTSSSLE